MAVSIKTPDFSFVQFGAIETVNCADDPNICLPVKDIVGGGDPHNDVQWMFLINATGNELTALTYGLTNPTQVGAAEIDFYLIPSDSACTGNAHLAQLLAQKDWTSSLRPLSAFPNIPCAISGYQFIGWPEAVAAHSEFVSLPVGGCFKIMAVYKLYVAGPGNPQTNTVLGCSNCFIKVGDECYTARFNYGNNSNAYGFYFACLDGVSIGTPPLLEAIRLPLYLHSQTQFEEGTQYAKSNGSTVRTSWRVWQDFKFLTDYWPKEWHTKFALITSLDTVEVTDTYADLDHEPMIRIEKIEIEWREDEIPMFIKGQAKGVLRKAAPIANVNSNCT